MHSSRQSNPSTSQVQGTEGSASTSPAGRDYYSDERGGVAPEIVRATRTQVSCRRSSTALEQVLGLATTMSEPRS